MTTNAAPPEAEPTEDEWTQARSFDFGCLCIGNLPCPHGVLFARALAAHRAAAPPRECDDPSHEGPHPKPDEPLICVACSIADTAEKFAAAAEREREAREIIESHVALLEADKISTEESGHAWGYADDLTRARAWLAGKGGDRADG